MNTLNIRNISLSLCLGVFSFHMYVVNTYSIGQKHSNTVNLVYRSLASVEDCKTVNMKSNNFTKESYKPATCEVLPTVIVSQKGKAFVRVYVKHGNVLKSYPPINKNPLKVLHHITFDDEAAVQKNLQFKGLVKNMKAEHIDPLIKEVQDLVFSEGLSGDVAISQPTDQLNLTTSEPTPEDSAPVATEGEGDVTVAANDQDADYEVDVDELREVVDTLKNLVKKSDQCHLTDEQTEETADLVKEIEELGGDQLSELRKRSILRKLSAENAQGISDLQESINDVLESSSENKFSRNERITCLSKKALKLNNKEQVAAYNSNIAPLVSGAIDGATDNQSLESIFADINSSDAFKELSTSNSTIDAITTMQSKASHKYLECKSSTVKTTCMQQLHTKIQELAVALEKTQAAGGDTTLIESELKFNAESLSKLTTILKNEQIAGVQTPGVQDPESPHHITVPGPLKGNSHQIKILNAVIKLNGESVPELEGSSARSQSRVIAPLVGGKNPNLEYGSPVNNFGGGGLPAARSLQSVQ